MPQKKHAVNVQKDIDLVFARWSKDGEGQLGPGRFDVANITDNRIGRLSQALKDMARDLDGQQHFNDDLRKGARELSIELMDLAIDGPRLSLFADLLSRHSNRGSALAELIAAHAA